MTGGFAEPEPEPSGWWAPRVAYATQTFGAPVGETWLRGLCLHGWVLALCAVPERSPRHRARSGGAPVLGPRPRGDDLDLVAYWFASRARRGSGVQLFAVC